MVGEVKKQGEDVSGVAAFRAIIEQPEAGCFTVESGGGILPDVAGNKGADSVNVTIEAPISAQTPAGGLVVADVALANYGEPDPGNPGPSSLTVESDYDVTNNGKGDGVLAYIYGEKTNAEITVKDVTAVTGRMTPGIITSWFPEAAAFI